MSFLDDFTTKNNLTHKHDFLVPKKLNDIYKLFNMEITEGSERKVTLHNCESQQKVGFFLSLNNQQKVENKNIVCEHVQTR